MAGGMGATSGGVLKGMKPGMLNRKVSVGLKGQINKTVGGNYGKSTNRINAKG